MIYRVSKINSVCFKIILPVLTAILLSGCIKKNIRNYKNLDIAINNDLHISADTIKKLIKIKLDRQKGSGTIEILIYSYSSGTEVIEYNENDGFKQHFSKGRISAMIKFKRSGKVKEVKFTSARGRSSDEIIKKLTLNINRIINDS
jgi:hypothetical protein